MYTFPTLTINPTYPLKWQKEDNTIKSNFEAGYVQTRSRNTRIRRKWSIVYELMPAADAVVLDAFIDSVNGATDAFYWVHPISGITYTVRFEAFPNKVATQYGDSQYLYNYDFTLVEV